MGLRRHSPAPCCCCSSFYSTIISFPARWHRIPSPYCSLATLMWLFLMLLLGGRFHLVSPTSYKLLFMRTSTPNYGLGWFADEFPQNYTSRPSMPPYSPCLSLSAEWLCMFVTVMSWGERSEREDYDGNDGVVQGRHHTHNKSRRACCRG